MIALNPYTLAAYWAIANNQTFTTFTTYTGYIGTGFSDSLNNYINDIGSEADELLFLIEPLKAS